MTTAQTSRSISFARFVNGDYAINERLPDGHLLRVGTLVKHDDGYGLRVRSQFGFATSHRTVSEAKRRARFVFNG